MLRQRIKSDQNHLTGRSGRDNPSTPRASAFVIFENARDGPQKWWEILTNWALMQQITTKNLGSKWLWFGYDSGTIQHDMIFHTAGAVDSDLGSRALFVAMLLPKHQVLATSKRHEIGTTTAATKGPGCLWGCSLNPRGKVINGSTPCTVCARAKASLPWPTLGPTLDPKISGMTWN